MLIYASFCYRFTYCNHSVCVIADSDIFTDSKCPR